MILFIGDLCIYFELVVVYLNLVFFKKKLFYFFSVLPTIAGVLALCASPPKANRLIDFIYIIDNIFLTISRKEKKKHVYEIFFIADLCTFSTYSLF